MSSSLVRIVNTSPYLVAVTIGKIYTSLEEKNIKIFTLIDHSEEAQ